MQTFMLHSRRVGDFELSQSLIEFDEMLMVGIEERDAHFKEPQMIESISKCQRDESKWLESQENLKWIK